MAMQIGMGLSKLVLLVGAGYAGTLLIKNNKLSEIVDELQNLVKGSGRSGNYTNADADLIAAQVRQLTQEVRQLANTRQFTVLNDLSSLILPAATLGALGYAYMWWKGRSIYELMYIPKHSKASVACLAENLQRINEALEKTKKHTFQRVQNFYGKIDEQQEVSKLILNEGLLLIPDAQFEDVQHITNEK